MWFSSGVQAKVKIFLSHSLVITEHFTPIYESFLYLSVQPSKSKEAAMEYFKTSLTLLLIALNISIKAPHVKDERDGVTIPKFFSKNILKPVLSTRLKDS